MNDINIVEVCPRDGFQNVKTIINTETKIEIIKILIDAGFKEIEIASFVSPKWIPQMADAVEVIEEIDIYRKVNGISVELLGLAPNIKGVDNAMKTSIDGINYPISVSELHNKSNVNRTRAESFSELKEIIEKYKGINVNLGLATTFGSPYEGDKIIIDDIISMTEKAFNIGVRKVILSDTVGIGNPNVVDEVLEGLKRYVDLDKISLHLHDTMGMALANTLVGLRHGIKNFESSAGGLGGCPFAPGAAGNIATEDLLNMLNLMGKKTGIDLRKVLNATELISNKVDSRLASRVYSYYNS